MWCCIHSRIFAAATHPAARTAKRREAGPGRERERGRMRERKMRERKRERERERERERSLRLGVRNQRELDGIQTCILLLARYDKLNFDPLR
jgi:hypothetical protein